MCYVIYCPHPPGCCGQHIWYLCLHALHTSMQLTCIPHHGIIMYLHMQYFFSASYNQQLCIWSFTHHVVAMHLICTIALACEQPCKQIGVTMQAHQESVCPIQRLHSIITLLKYSSVCDLCMYSDDKGTPLLMQHICALWLLCTAHHCAPHARVSVLMREACRVSHCPCDTRCHFKPHVALRRRRGRASTLGMTAAGTKGAGR